MHKIIANIASIAHVASGFLENSIAIAIAHIARSERALTVPCYGVLITQTNLING